MRRCFLHVGTHKTGTTAIQRWCSDHAAALAALGYRYPRAGQWSQAPGHHDLAIELSQPERVPVKQVDALFEEVGDDPGHLILSSEVFTSAAVDAWPAFEGFVRRLRSRGFDVTIVLYVRPQHEWLPRLYLTLIWFGLARPFDEVAREVIATGGLRFQDVTFLFDQVSLADRFAALPGVTLLVRRYVAAVCADFLSVLGLDARALVPVEPRHNVSLPIHTYLAEFLRSRGRRPLPWIGSWALRRIVAPAAAVRMSDEMTVAIQARFAESNRELCRRLGVPDPAGAPSSASPPFIDRLFTEETARAMRRFCWPPI